MLIIYKFIDNIHQTYIDKFLICKFLKNFKIIILSIVSSLIFLVKHDEHFYIARICKYLPLYTSGDHWLTSKLFESNGQRWSSNEKKEKGKEREEEEVSVVACRRAPLGPTILSHMTHWNRTLRDSERRPGVPSGRRRPDMPSHRGPIVGWCHATGTWLHRNCTTVPPRSRPADSPLLPFAFAFVHDHF